MSGKLILARFALHSGLFLGVSFWDYVCTLLRMDPFITLLLGCCDIRFHLDTFASVQSDQQDFSYLRSPFLSGTFRILILVIFRIFQ